MHGGTSVASGTGFGLGDIIGVLADYDTGALTFLKNNTAAVSYTGIPTGDWYPMATLDEGDTATANFAYADFTYTDHGAYAYDDITYTVGGPNYAESWDTASVIGTVSIGMTSARAVVDSTAGAIQGLLTRNTGQYFFRLVPQTYPGDSLRFGFMIGNTLTTALGDDPDAYVMKHDGANGLVWNNSSISAYIGYSTADPFDFYIDMDAGSFTIYNAYGSYSGTFTSNSDITPVFAGVATEECDLYVTNADLDGTHLDGTYSAYLAWHDAL